MSTAAERQAAYRERKRTGQQWAPKPCGTIAAARRHQRAGEALCGLCGPVWVEHQADMYQQRKSTR